MADAIKECFIYYFYYGADQFQNSVCIFKRNPSNQELDADAMNGSLLVCIVRFSFFFAHVPCRIKMCSFKSDTKKYELSATVLKTKP